MKLWTLPLIALVTAMVGAGIAWHRTPETAWYEIFDCPRCGAETLLEGLVVRRYIILLVIPIPLWRDWVVRCNSCKTTIKIEKDEWRRRAKDAFSVEEVQAMEAQKEIERARLENARGVAGSKQHDESSDQ